MRLLKPCLFILLGMILGVAAGNYMTNALADVPYPRCKVNSGSPEMEVQTMVQDNGNIYVQILAGDKIIDHLEQKTNRSLLIVTRAK